MLAKEPLEFEEKLHITTYIITVVFTVMRYILTYIDKQLFDGIFIADMIVGFSLLIILTLPFIKYINGTCLWILILGILWIVNFVLPFFVYSNRTTDYFTSICLFMIVVRMFSIFANIVYWCSHLS